VAAAAWIGGMIALAAVVVPVLRHHQPRRDAMQLLHDSGMRLRSLGWVALVLLVLTGLVQAGYRSGGFAALASAALWTSPWGQLLAAKLVLVAAILCLAGIHDFRIGPRATLLSLEDPEAPAALRLRRRASWFGRVNLLLSLAVVGLGLLLVRGVG
jgi:putative copper export protein